MKHYALRFTNRGSYATLGRRCIVRTFATEYQRDEYVRQQPPKNSVTFDGERRAMPASTLLTEQGTGRLTPIAEAVPGI